MEAKLIRLTVNGRDEAVVADPLATLQDVLRDTLELTAVKSGCGQGGCGSCSVLVDGELRLSCLTLAERVEGAEVTTLEGLNETNAIVPLQQAFVDNYAAQCGYCTAGMVMAAKALLDRNPAPSREEIIEGLAGNLCRCTGFAPIVPGRAAGGRSAVRQRGGGKLMSMRQLGVVGRNVGQRDLQSHARGQTTYYEDVRYPRMLHLKMHRSAEPHARIVSVDTSAAEASPGVVCVLTHEDLPGKKVWNGLAAVGVGPEDEPILAFEKVRWRGEPIVAVVGESAEAARAGAARVKVEYKPAARRLRRGGGDRRRRAGADRPLAAQSLHLPRRSRRIADSLRRRRAGIRRG